MPETSLATLQHKIYRLITAPEGVAVSLINFPEHLPLKGDAKMPAARRLDIYANMYFYRIHDALREDFPLVGRFLGKTDFHNLITDYLAVHPPLHFSLRHAGAELPCFIKSHPLSLQHPWLADLALYEELLLECFDAADATTDIGLLKNLAPEQWALLKFYFVPALKLVTFDFPIHKIIPKIRRSKKFAPVAEKTPFRFWRHHFEVYGTRITPDEFQTMTLLQQEKSFGDVSEQLARTSDAKTAAGQLAVFLQRWLKENLIEKITL